MWTLRAHLRLGVDLPVMPPAQPMLAKTTTLEKALAQLPDVQIERTWDAEVAMPCGGSSGVR